MSSARTSDAALELRREVDALERRLYELRAGLCVWEPLVGTLSLLECQAGEDRIALLMHQVDRVVAVAALTPIPEMPGWVPGLLQVRGASIPVIDVTTRFKRAAGARGSAEGATRLSELSDLIVLCSVKGAPVGLLVQAVHGLSTIEASAVEEPAENVPRAPYIRGAVMGQNHITLVVDLESLVTFSGLAMEPA